MEELNINTATNYFKEAKNGLGSKNTRSLFTKDNWAGLVISILVIAYLFFFKELHQGVFIILSASVIGQALILVLAYRNKVNYAIALFFLMSYVVIFMIAMLSPQIKNEALFFIPIGLTTFFFVLNYRVANYIFYLSLLFGVSFYLYEFIYYSNIPINSEYNFYNQCIIAAFFFWVCLRAGTLVYTYRKTITQLIESQKKTKEQAIIYEALINNSFSGIDVLEIVKLDMEKFEFKAELLNRNDVMKSFIGTVDKAYVSIDEVMEISPELQNDNQTSIDSIKMFVRTLHEEGIARYPWKVISPKGKIIDLSVVAHRVMVNDKRLIIRVAEDVTLQIKQRQIIKEQMDNLNGKNLQLERYIKSNEQLENFAYVASHDLKAPLRTINSYTNLLERKLKNKLTEDELEFMNFIRSATKNLQTLVEDLLIYSKANSSKLNVDEVDLGSLIEEVYLELNSLVREKEAEIQICENLPNVIKGDKVKLRQLFQNLIQNAIKFSREDVKPIIKIHCEETNDFYEFEIEDNCIGIREEFIGKVFDLFRRLNKASDYEGSGIGLALCKKIVEQHGGSINLKSQEGEGSTFSFSIKKGIK